MKLPLLALLVALAPLAAGAPSACADPCVVDSDTIGYRPPVAVIASGASVVWESTDRTHITRDGVNMLDPDPCFYVVHDPGVPAPAVRFDLAGGVLSATVDGVTTACATATALPAGGAALPYYCVLHPTMRGVLVVTE